MWLMKQNVSNFLCHAERMSLRLFHLNATVMQFPGETPSWQRQNSCLVWTAHRSEILERRVGVDCSLMQKWLIFVFPVFWVSGTEKLFSVLRYLHIRRAFDAWQHKHVMTIRQWLNQQLKTAQSVLELKCVTHLYQTQMRSLWNPTG